MNQDKLNTGYLNELFQKLTNQGSSMEFPVGEGLNPEQAKTAQETVTKPTIPVGEEPKPEFSSPFEAAGHLLNPNAPPETKKAAYNFLGESTLNTILGTTGSSGEINKFQGYIKKLENDLNFKDLLPFEKERIYGLIRETQDKIKNLQSESTFQGFEDLTTKFLDYAKGKTTLSKQEIMDFARRPELKKGEADLLASKAQGITGNKVSAQEFADSIHRDLLPLKPVKVKSPQYEMTTIGDKISSGYPKNKNYEEVVFESPINTNGSSHYPNSKNYFAHARGDEVMEGGKKIWREQEIQSDLLQKEGMERTFRDAYSDALEHPGEIPNSQSPAGKRVDEVNKLQPFTNDRFGERIMRERIRNKFDKGYDSYMIPTGETIGKIEGFDVGNWATLPEGGGFGARLKPEDLKVGMPIQHNNDTEWIITDILGDGRFKAMPKNQYNLLQQKVETYIGSQYQKFNKPEDYFAFAKKEGFDFARAEETFDITGKSNPQYRRYQDWGKFLKNKFNGYPYTDPQGNTWMKVDKPSDYKKGMPIEAFAAVPFMNKDQDNQNQQKLDQSYFEKLFKNLVNNQNGQ